MNETPSGYSVYALAQALRSGSRDDVRAALHAERVRTLALTDVFQAALGPGLPVPQADELNPPLWELGHVAWFQQWWITRNRQRALGASCDPAHDRGPSDLAGADDWYHSSEVVHARRWSLSLPDLPATLDWLAATQQETLALLDALPAQASHDALYFYRLVCLHEAMHNEAACFMAWQLGVEVPPFLRAPRALAASPEASEPAVLHVPACAWRLGSASPGFAFDNELGANEVALAAFEIDTQPVSWRRFAAFVEAGGYRDARWWSDEGWAWRQQARPADPWFPQDSAPAAHLSAHEAQAWCHWAGRRLPTEAQWECAALTAPGFAWGRVWEWTASAFLPYPGFTPHPYRDYSAPWFGSRRVLRGASEATSACLAHPRYRNFFEPHRTDVQAGFRSCA